MSSFFAVTQTFKAPVETNSASFWAWVSTLDLAAEQEKHIAAGFYNHSFMPTGKTGTIICIWEAKFEVEAGALQTYLDTWSNGFLNQDIKRIDVQLSGSPPFPKHFTSPAADVKIIKLINEKVAADEIFVAFEYYPPRTESGVTNLLNRCEVMAKQDPMYSDVTWGAGGSTSDLTVELCKKMQHRYNMIANMHLTCTNMEVSKIDEALAVCKEYGINNIVALRGDPPAGQDKWEATDSNFACGLDLVRYIRDKYGDYFGISVAGYPEGHPNVLHEVKDKSTLSASELTRLVENADGMFVCNDADYEKEMAYLKEKVDAGADFIITQMFFDVDVFFKFCDDCKERGIMCPVMPGIMLIQAYGGFKRMTSLCKSRVPQNVVDAMEAVKDSSDDVKAYGTKFGVEVCQALIAKGHKGLHLYTLNQDKVTFGVMEQLGIKK